MKKTIENIHNDVFYKIFLNKINNTQLHIELEYELYFNYILKYHTDKYKLRNLKWENMNTEQFKNIKLDMSFVVLQT